MTTATLNLYTLEELVDRLPAALFRAEPESAQSPARTVHEARRLGQAGDLDGALAALADVNTNRATDAQLQCLYAEWLDIALRRFAGAGAMLYSPGTGRAAALVHYDGNGTLEVAAVLGLRWQTGKLASHRSLRGLKPLTKGGLIMVVSNRTVDLQELKSRQSLGDVVEAAGVALRGKGRVRQGVCPFHDEAAGSFTVYSDSEKFYCFGCGLGGDVLDFVRRTEGLTLPEAMRRLDGETGVPLRAAVPGQKTSKSQRPTAPLVPSLDPGLLTVAVRFYAGQLRRSQAAQEYLASRGIGPDAAARLGLGYAPGHGLRHSLESGGFGGNQQRASGLFLERGAERFAGMVAVPDTASGRVGWLTGRAVDPGAKPRFQAVPGPNPALGLARLGPAPPWVIVAEDVFDWLTLMAWGHPACAALGTQGLERVAEAQRGRPRVFLAFDHDGAGLAATECLKGLLGRRAAVGRLPQGVADMGELATLPHGQLLFHHLLARAARSAR